MTGDGVFACYNRFIGSNPQLMSRIQESSQFMLMNNYNYITEALNFNIIKYSIIKSNGVNIIHIISSHQVGYIKWVIIESTTAK